MVTRDTAWPPGTPCWADIVTSDAAAAHEFYGSLFDWTLEVGGEETGFYARGFLDGRSVAGIGTMPSDHPPAWTTYLAVTDADATAAAITAHGGTLLQGPMDVGPFGRMIIAADPTGGVFGVWQAGTNHGAEVANVTGTVIWNELLTRELTTAKDFYASVFGWTYTPLGDTYATFEVDGNTAGGIGELAADVPADVPAHWRTYFAVDDCDAAVAKAESLGGRVLRPAADMPYGRHADLADPQGTLFVVITPAQPD